MNLYIANDSKQGLGGGWSFLRNFITSLPAGRVEITNIMEDAGVVLLPSSSMVASETVERAMLLQKPIVLRIDNIPKNSRNRNTGTSRLRRYAEAANAIIYQSEWARDYVGGWLGHDEDSDSVIYNGIDIAVFNPDGDHLSTEGVIALYTRYNRDETKGWHVAWYEFQQLHRDWKKNSRKQAPPELWIAGQFSPELVQYDFDFFNGEVVNYLGVMEDPHEYAKILRTADYFYAPYYNDACSNCIIEALACGTSVECFGFEDSGGTPEIMRLDADGFDWSKERMAREYMKVFASLR